MKHESPLFYHHNKKNRNWHETVQMRFAASPTLLARNSKAYVPIIKIYVRMHLLGNIIKQKYHFNRVEYIVSCWMFFQSKKKKIKKRHTKKFEKKTHIYSLPNIH